MAKLHSSLSPTTNILFLIVWAAVAALFLFVVEPHAPILLAVMGAVLGVIGGVMQHWSFAQAAQGFSAASTWLEVRRALKATPWGARYIRFLFFSNCVLMAFAFGLVRQPLSGVLCAYLAGYFSFMFAREIVTLRDTFLLHRLASNARR